MSGFGILANLVHSLRWCWDRLEAMWHSIRKCVRTVLVVLVYYLLISKDRSPVSPFLFFVVFTQEMQKMYKYVTAWANHFSSGFYKLSLVTCMNVTSVCHAPEVISEHCVCGTQVHSGRVKRSSGKKHDELDLICHPCPEVSHTHSHTHTRTRTNTHTTPHHTTHALYAIHHSTNKIT